MTSRKAIGLAASLVLGTLSLAAVAVPANAAWWGNGQWQPDNRYYYNNQQNRYYGYHYRAPPVIYSTPYNYGYVPPPVIYDNAPGPGFSIMIRP